jgi:hypothetical protein
VEIRKRRGQGEKRGQKNYKGKKEVQVIIRENRRSGKR